MRIWQYTSLKVDAEKETLGGVAVHIDSLSKAWEKMGHQVHIGLTCPFEPDIVHTHGDFLPWNFLSSILRSRHILNAKNSSANTAKLKQWIHVFHGTSLGRMLACNEFFSLSGYKGVLRELAICLQADAGIAVSEMAAKQAVKMYKFHKKIEVIPNGSDSTIFTPLTSITDQKIAAFVGRSDDRVKNTDMLLNACKKVFLKHSDFELWAFPGILKNQGTAISTNDYPFLKNLGALPSDRLVQKLQKTKMLILCSLYEGDPIVVHEAMALGLPIVASKIPSMQTLLKQYQNVFFIDPSREDSILEAVFKVLETNPDKFNPKLAAIGRDWTLVAQEFLETYQRLLP